MHCLKCGRKIDDADTFCADCLAVMEKYPVQPGTVVKLPSHPAASAVKKRFNRKKKPLKPEEQIAALRTRCRRLTILLIFSLIVTIAAVCTTLWVLGWLDSLSIPDIGLPFVS